MATVKKSMTKIKKAQRGADLPTGARTADSTAYYMDKNHRASQAYNNTAGALSEKDRAGYKREAYKAADDAIRQSNKGYEGFDKNGFPVPKRKNGGKMAKAKSGGSFPDLNKDGKITKADVLKGRGVIAKKGAKVAKKAMPCASCGKSMKKK